MQQYTNFHCQLSIRRKIFYEDSEENITSQYQAFYHQVPTPVISVGCDPQRAIFFVEGLSPVHFKMNFESNSLNVGANDSITISREGKIKTLQPGQITVIPFSENKIIDINNLLEWQMEFSPVLQIEGLVLREEETLPAKKEVFLEKNYDQLIKINEGHSSLLYLTGKQKVIKALRPSCDQRKESFLLAATRLQQCPSNFLCRIENIVPLPVCHLLMEYFPAETLENYIARKGFLEYKEAITILRQLIKGLLSLRQHDYEPKYLSPQRILRNDKGQLKMIGTEVMLADKLAQNHLCQYFAPEYFKKKPEKVICGDIFSLGMIFYKMLTGKLPFIGQKQYQQAMEKQDFVDRYTLQRSSPKITPQLAELLEAMLTFKGKDRISVEEIAAWVNEISDFEEWENYLKILRLFASTTSRYCIEVASSVKQQKIKTYSLEDGQTLIIGRMAEIHLRGDTQISRKHAEVKAVEGKCLVKDLGSSNGTWFQGQRVSECELESGATFVVGESTLRFWDKEVAEFAFCLQIVNSVRDQKIKVFSLSDNSQVVIGRKGDIEIAGDYKISKQHAQLQIIDGMCTIRDLGSENGTWVNKQKIKKHPLTSGDAFMVGSTILRFWDYNNIKKSRGILTQTAEEEPEPVAPVAISAKDLVIPELENIFDIGAPTASEVEEDSFMKTTIRRPKSKEELPDGIERETHKIRSNKLDQFYKTISMRNMAPEKESRTRRLEAGKNLFSEKRHRLSLAFRVTGATIAVLALLLFFGTSYLISESRSPNQASKKVQPTDFEQTQRPTQPKSNPIVSPPPAQIAAKKVRFSLQGDFIGPQALKIEGETSLPRFRLVLKRSDGKVMFLKKIAVEQGKYQEVFSIPEDQNAFSLHIASPDIEFKRAYRLPYPQGFVHAKNLKVAGHAISLFCRQLQIIAAQFLSHKNVSMLETKLNIWENKFDELRRQIPPHGLSISYANFGKNAAKMLRLLEQIETLEGKLRGFLLYQFNMFPGLSKLHQLIEYANAQANVEKIRNLSRSIWQENPPILFAPLPSRK